MILDAIFSFLLNILVLGGGFFTLVAAIGVVRFPDFYCRTHAAAKAGAFGGALLVLATGIALGDWWNWAVSLLVLIFFYFTTPVASHLLGRAARMRGVGMYRKPKGGV